MLLLTSVFVGNSVFVDTACAQESESKGSGERDLKKMSREELEEQLNKLKLLEQKNVSKLKQYESNPTASIKLKSNLVIIRLKIRSISKLLGLENQDEPGTKK
jgi:ribosomal protein L29